MYTVSLTVWEADGDSDTEIKTDCIAVMDSGPVAEFLRFLLSREGQQVVADGGNIPLDGATVAEGRQAME